MADSLAQLEINGTSNKLQLFIISNRLAGSIEKGMVQITCLSNQDLLSNTHGNVDFLVSMINLTHACRLLMSAKISAVTLVCSP